VAGQTYLLDKTYRNDANQRILKYTALVAGLVNGAGYATVPGAANAPRVLGVAQEDIVENGVNAWVGGVAQITSGQAPVAGAPTQLGKNVRVAKAGIARVIAAGAIAVGDWVNVADNQGRVKTVSEAAGTLVNVLGQAETAAANAGDIIHVALNIHSRHA